MFGSDNISGESFQKIILIILFLFLTLALIATWMVPATGFESSIYVSTPLVLWVALIFSEVAGISLVILAIADADFEERILWKYGLLLVFLVNAVLLSLFMIRGYYMWVVGDPASHIGWIKEIINTGQIPSNLIYPALHIFLAEISMVTSLDLVFLHKFIPFFYGLISVVFIYLFMRILSPDRTLPPIAVILACPFAFNIYLTLTPNDLSSLLLPLVFFLFFKYLKSNNPGWGILLCVSLVLYPVFHPLPSIVLAIVFLSLWIFPACRDLWNRNEEKNRSLLKIMRRNMNAKVMVPFLILAMWFIFWYSSFTLWGKTIVDMYQTVNSEGSGSASSFSNLAQQVSYAQGYGYNVFEIFLKLYGPTTLILLLSILAFPFIWKMVSKDQKQDSLFSLYGPWGILCLIIPILYIFHLPFGPLRFLAYLCIMGTVFVAYLLGYLLTRYRNMPGSNVPRITSILVISLLCGLILCASLALYPAPYSVKVNFQTTHHEIIGMEHFFEYRNVSVPVTGINIEVPRMGDLLLTPDERLRQNLPEGYMTLNQTPYHFGYDRFPSIAYSYTEKTNLIVTQKDKAVYIDYYPDMAKFRYSQADFNQLKGDPGADLVYQNGEFDLLTLIPKIQGVI